MKITLEKASGRAICRYPRCSENPEYINDMGYIKKGTVCAWIAIGSAGGGASACYCRECLEKVHDDIRMSLNPKLWAFS
jgi:hypothetical protein